VADSSSGLFFPGVYLGIRLSIRMSSMIQAQGQTATVIFDGNFVILQRRGFLARMTVGKGDKKIPIGSISAVQWKPASAILRPQSAMRMQPYSPKIKWDNSRP
jgi:hypothetical protein